MKDKVKEMTIEEYSKTNYNFDLGIVDKDVKITDEAEGITIISSGERDQLRNKEKAYKYITAIEQLEAKEQECKKVKEKYSLKLITATCDGIKDCVFVATSKDELIEDLTSHNIKKVEINKIEKTEPIQMMNRVQTEVKEQECEDLKVKLKVAVGVLKVASTKSCMGCKLFIGNICNGAKSYEPDGELHHSICMEHRNTKLTEIQRNIKQAIEQIEGCK